MNGFENVEIVDDTNLGVIMGGAEPADDKNQQSKNQQNNKNQKSSGKDDSATPSKGGSASSKQDLDSAFGSIPDEDDTTEDIDDNENIEDTDDDDTVDVADDDTKDEDNKDEDNVDDAGKDKDDKNADPSIEDTKAFLKARVDFLIKNGEWADFDGREEIEWDEETFGEHELSQRAFLKQQMQEELLDEFGPYGRQIAEYSKNGGDPDKLLDIFKEQQRIESWDVSTEEGQKQLVFKYQTEVEKRSPARVQKNIERLIADNELKEEAEDVQKTLQKQLEEEQEAVQEEQRQLVKKQKQQQQDKITKFSSDVSTVLDARKDIPDTEKIAIKKMLTVFKDTPDGPINGFAQRFIEFRKDLNNYIDLVRLVNNPKAFKKATGTERANAVAEKDFRLVRTNNYTKKSGSKSQNRTAKKSSNFKLM